MKQKSYKFFSKYTIFIIVVSCVLNGMIWIVFHGIPIVGIPKVEEVESITIYYNDVQQQEIVENEKIELLIKASNLLNYKFLGKIKEKEQPIICITYHLKNGNDVMIKANNTTVWRNEKLYEIKQKDIFVNIVEGIFFDIEKE